MPRRGSRRPPLLHLLLSFGMGIYCSQFPSFIQATPGPCKSKNISHYYERCGIHQDGARDLDCFGKHTVIGVVGNWYCVYTPQNHTSEKSYTLVIMQQKGKAKCLEYNITSGKQQQINTRKLNEGYNMTAHVFDKNCTKAFFTGLPKHLIRCSPPKNASFRWHRSELQVNVIWKAEDKEMVQDFTLRYKAQGDELWNETSVTCVNGERCTVGGLSPKLSHQMWIRCVPNQKCPQCQWSDVYHLPPELTTKPEIVEMEENAKKGCRLLVIRWKFAFRELVEGYNVSIGKASGEPPHDWMTITQPELRLILSFSDYYLNITAFNNASTSPAVSQMIPSQERDDTEAGKLMVTFNNSTSLNISWQNQNYICYSVELSSRENKAAYLSFFEDKKNSRTISLKEPLQPYKRYRITLHTRPNKQICNMKRVNNSESTYGSMGFYFKEGSPSSAPTNVSFTNVTTTSVRLEWQPIPEEDARGFLRGYVINCDEYHQGGTRSERNITVDPAWNMQEVVNLKSGTVYLVQISAFTDAGVGVRSAASYFETKSQDHLRLNGSIEVSIVAVTVLFCMICFGSLLLKRAKGIIWPKIPDPSNSNAVQRMDGSHELELLKPVSIEKLEEVDAYSLRLGEEEARTAHSGSFSPLPSRDSRDGGDEGSSETCSDAAGGEDPSEDAAASQCRDPRSVALAFPGDYTTMELFQQVMPQHFPPNASTAANQTATIRPEELGTTVNGKVYVRQFSNQPSQ